MVEQGNRRKQPITSDNIGSTQEKHQQHNQEVNAPDYYKYSNAELYSVTSWRDIWLVMRQDSCIYQPKWWNGRHSTLKML